ncbi:dihydrolipoamide acetyltransferase family protein [uncultured Hoeflea sp.]|uniref:dihydrolipoamide acetyltransferase family protein n=1 Tax=uncultured Hoeflea sp. TaxID=538666 RepID=UPI002614B224|nr:dihydrolipoamide acetyltransferase family protein [uncultured Hoeflea sp.]
MPNLFWGAEMGVFAMPSLGSDMEAGTLIEWLVKPGDAVKRGDVVAVVETQKGAIEIETFEAGRVHQLQAKLGQKLPVGAPLAVILAEGEDAPTETAGLVPEKAVPGTESEPPAAASIAEPAPLVRQFHTAPIPTSPVVSRSGDPVASPAARKRAAELGLDLSTIQGSGLGGAIQLTDVENAATKAPASPLPASVAEKADVTSSPADEMRRAIATAMARSKREIPHFYVNQTIDLSPASQWLEATNADRDPVNRILMGALFVRASVLAAGSVPTINGHYENDTFSPSIPVHAGVAVALRGGGLVAPAIVDADKLTLDETMDAMRDLVTRARAGRLRGSEMTKGTLTISALGETGAEAMSGVIFPPQVALVGIGAPQRRPWVIGTSVEPRNTVTITLSVDHRVCDGRQAARFLAKFETSMQSPEAL